MPLTEVLSNSKDQKFNLFSLGSKNLKIRRDFSSEMLNITKNYLDNLKSELI